MAQEQTIAAAPGWTDEEYQRAGEQLWRSYEVINEWIRFADTKAGALLTLNGVLFAAALGQLKDRLPFLEAHPLFCAFAIVLGAALVASAIACFECIRPRVQVRLPHKQPATHDSVRSVIFFEDIAAHSQETAFARHVMNRATPQAAFEDINKQVWLVSNVASRKHRCILCSVWLLHVAIAVGVALLLSPLSWWFSLLALAIVAAVLFALVRAH